MKRTGIPYHQTGYFSKLIIDYLNGNENLVPFYNKNFSIESFAEQINERSLIPVDRKILVQALQKQYQSVEASELTLSNILKLNNNNCYTVTTGHQLNLFTGPLYFIYKIISCINLAKELKLTYPDKDFVPVYWMATEDHDFEEINHFNVFGNKIELKKTHEGAVGQMKLKGIKEMYIQLEKALDQRSEKEKIVNLFKSFYTEESTFTEATRAFVNHLFSHYGLVIIDGNDKALKQLMAQEFKNELVQQQNHLLIYQTTEEIRKLGHKSQVNPREINLFYLQNNSRERIVFENRKFHVLNTTISFSEIEILAELDNFPERFSPNVALRPLYQEKILPNLAYIGGGGELGYWFQLKEMFRANQIGFPILVLRNSALLMDEGSMKKLDKIGWMPSRLFDDTDALIKEYLKEGSDIILDLKKEENEIASVFSEMIKKAEKIDATLKPMIGAELQKTIKTIQHIEAKLIKAEKQKELTTVNQIQNIKDKLFPNGSLQEREENLILLHLLFGFDGIDQLIENLHPFKQEFSIIN